MALLEIKNLHARVAAPGGKDILKGVDLTINLGEVHAIMGKNGSGKSTLANVIMGREAYDVTEGSITYNGMDVLDMDPEERAHEGIFLAFQYPVEIPGVSTDYFLKAAVNATRKHKGLPDLNAAEFIKLIKDKMTLLKMDNSFMRRAINEGFSGGEKKRNEVFQMAVCDPTLCLMDETDSGLDIDALRTVSGCINALRGPQRTIVLVTHHERFLKLVAPDHVHVMMDGRIVKSGGPELANALEERGYDWIEKEVAAAVQRICDERRPRFSAL